MKKKNYNSFKLLKTISYVRICGSKEEKECAKFIFDYCQSRGVNVCYEEFEIDKFDIQKVSLLANGKEIECSGYGMSGSTDEKGLTAPFKYIENGNDEVSNDIEGKIVLVDGRMTYKIYKSLIDNKALGFICTSGSVYDNKKDSDLPYGQLRARHYDLGKIPGVVIRAKDAHNLVLQNPSDITLTIIQNEGKKKSQNVVATIPGKSKKIIGFSAHYDSVEFSSGAYDNATGSTAIIELMEYYIANPHDRTLKFIWFGSEEVGLLGSKHYVEKHKDELVDFDFLINIDMIGVVLGYDIACCSAENELVSYINYLGKINGFPIKAKQGVYSSDSTSFADYGVPALSFARLTTGSGAQIHSRKDVIDFLDEKNYYKTCGFIKLFSDSLVNAINFPVSKTIPENVKKDLDKYNGRDEEKKENK